MAVMARRHEPRHEGRHDGLGPDGPDPGKPRRGEPLPGRSDSEHAGRAPRHGTEGGLDPWLLEVYTSDYRRLVRLAVLLVDDVGLAEEVVQDAFVRIARTRRSIPLDDEGAAAAYVRSAVLNGARSRLRKRAVRRRHLRSVDAPASAPAADGPAIAGDDHRRMLATLSRLPGRQREVLVLRYYGDLSEAEIADALGISTGSVKTHAHRGLTALAEHLDREG